MGKEGGLAEGLVFEGVAEVGLLREATKDRVGWEAILVGVVNFSSMGREVSHSLGCARGAEEVNSAAPISNIATFLGKGVVIVSNQVGEGKGVSEDTFSSSATSSIVCNVGFCPMDKGGVE